MKRIRQSILNFCAVLLLFTLTGCDVGEGRGDWTMDIFADYTIVKVNSSGIGLCRENGGLGWKSVLDNYFVTGFQAKEPYICIRGIMTRDRWISEEELAANKVVYYFLNTDTEELVGPFVTFDALCEYCTGLSVTVQNKWIDIDRKDSKPPEIRDTGMIVPPRVILETGSDPEVDTKPGEGFLSPDSDPLRP